MAQRGARLKRSFAIGAGKVAVFDSYLSPARRGYLKHIVSELGTPGLMPSSYVHKEPKHHVTKLEVSSISEAPFVQELMALIRKELKLPVRELRRAYVTESSYGEMSFAHRDLNGKLRGAAAVIYLNPVWKPEWEGETLFFAPTGEAQHAVSVKPGRLLLVDYRVLHRQGVPSRMFFGRRLSLVMNFSV